MQDDRKSITKHKEVKKRKVLIVSYLFPPLNCMAAKRYGIMCKYLSKNGYIPYIITAKSRKGCFILSKLDLEIPISKEQITRVGIIGDGYPICNLGLLLLCDYVHKQKICSRVVEELSFGWYEKVKRELDVKKYEDIDVVIGTYPSIGNLLVARYIAKKLKKPFVAEIRDLISDFNEVEFGEKRVGWFDKISERMLLRNANGIVTVTKGFQRILEKRYPGKKIATVYNGWDGSPEKEGVPEKKYLYYAGSLYEHRLESLSVLINVVAKLHQEMDLELIIRSEGPAHLNFKAAQMISKMGLSQVVKLLEAEKEEVIKKEEASAYINVVLSTIHNDDVALMTTVPGKVMELMNNKPPVLAIIPAESDVGELLKYTNKGVATIDESKILEFILSGGNEYRGNGKVTNFSRERQAKKLCKYLDQIISNGQ